MHETFDTLYALRLGEAGGGGGGGGGESEASATGSLALRWATLHTHGRAPAARARPNLVPLDELLFLICGVSDGRPLNTVELLDTRTLTWSQPVVEGMPPTPRMGATATRVGTDVCIFGGSDGKGSLADLHVMTCVSWSTPQWLGDEPKPRVGHTLTAVGARLWMLGGASRGVAHNDLYVLDPATQARSKPHMYGACPEALVGHSTTLVGYELFV